MKMCTEFKPLFSFTRQHTPLWAIETAQTPEQIFNPGAHSTQPRTEDSFLTLPCDSLSIHQAVTFQSVPKPSFASSLRWSVTDDRPSQIILPPVRVGSHLLLLCISAALRLRVKFLKLCVSALSACSALGIFSIRVVSEVRKIQDNRANGCAFSFGDAVFALIVTRLRAVLINVSEIIIAPIAPLGILKSHRPPRTPTKWLTIDSGLPSLQVFRFFPVPKPHVAKSAHLPLLRHRLM